MDYLLIIVLGIIVLVFWNKSRYANERLGTAIDRLQRELDFLRSQVETLARSHGRRTEAAESPFTPQTAQETEPARSVQDAPPRLSGFVSPAPTKPVTSPPTLVSPGVEVGPSPAPSPPKQPQIQPVARPIEPEHPEPALGSDSRADAAFQGGAGSVHEPATKARIFSIEETLGANWLNKIGIAILVIGLAFFLAYKLQTWGPGGKVLCGFAVSVALLGGGVWLERKPTYRIFARGGIGGGWALAYFTTFAMHHLQAARILDSLPADLALMLLVAAGMVGHSLRYRSQTVTSLAFLLGFVTLLTSHVEEPNRTVVFSLAASVILAVALVVVTTIRHWAILELCGVIAVYTSHFVWLSRVLPENHAVFAEFWSSTVLILLYWLIFRLAYVLRTPLDKKEEDLSSVSAVVNSGGVLGLLKYQSEHPEWAFWALVVLGAFELGLAYWAKSKRRQAFVVLSTIAVVLLVSSIPFRFHGVSWPVLWLVQAQVLAIAGLRLGEPLFRRLGLLTGLITGGVLALNDVMPLAFERLVAREVGTHWSLTAGLALATLLYWTHAEVYPRRWPQIAANPIESLALRITSWLALGAAGACLWVVLPLPWVAVGWLALVLALGLAADWIASGALALQADALAIASLVGLAGWDLGRGDWEHRIPLLVGIALLYCGMRRKTISGVRNYVPASYSWAGAGLLMFLAFDIFRDPWTAPVLTVLCLGLFEIGRFARKGFFRWQGYALLAVGFTVYLGNDISYGVFGLAGSQTAKSFSLVGSDLLEVLILLMGGYWLFDRTGDAERITRGEHVIGLFADVIGTFCLMVWFGVRLPFYVPGGEGWIAAIWAAMATILMALAWLMRQRIFLVKAIALAIASVLRGLLFDLTREAHGDFWHGALYRLSVAELLLLAALPFSFRLRGPEFWARSSIQVPEPFARALRHPEQWFFFAPFGLMIVALAAELSSGRITIAWSLLGLGVFLLALAVGERSFRLAGLALLLVSVAKILLMDVWKLAAPDRYTTLIVLGLALLAVSFLYTRFSETIRKYL